MRGIFRTVDSVKRVHFQTVGIFQRIISSVYDREIHDLNEKFAAVNYNFPPRITKNIGSEKYKARTARQAGILTFDTSDGCFPLFILFIKYFVRYIFSSKIFTAIGFDVSDVSNVSNELKIVEICGVITFGDLRAGAFPPCCGIYGVS